MKRFSFRIAAVLMLTLSLLLTACGEQAALVATTPTQDTAPTTDSSSPFDAAFETYHALYRRADPAALETAAPEALWSYLMSQGYASKEELKAFLETEGDTLVQNMHGDTAVDTAFTVSAYEQLTEENTAAFLTTFSLQYGIEKSAVTAVYYVTCSQNGTETVFTAVEIDKTYYLVESFDVIMDYSYYLWSTTD